MLMTPPNQRPYEILSNYFLGRLLVRRGNKVTSITPESINPDGSIKKSGDRKLNSSKYTVNDLDTYKDIFNDNSIKLQLLEELDLSRKFHLAAAKDYSHKLSLTTDAKHANQYICVYSDYLKAPIYYGKSAKKSKTQKHSEQLAIEHAIFLTLKLAAKFLPPKAKLLLELSTDCQSLVGAKKINCGKTLLYNLAKKNNLGVKLKWIQGGKKNPADIYTTCEARKGYDIMEHEKNFDGTKLFESKAIQREI